MAPSRGESISAYIPAFSEAKVYTGQMKYSKVSGTIANSGVVYAVAHGLAAAPTVVIITLKGTVGNLKASATSAATVGLATVSAATATNFYVAGAKNSRFDAVCIL
jgi:hypothetical protein